MQVCTKNNLVTFGIVPTHPETGYGYIESEILLNKKHNSGSKIKKFIEKPNQELAEKLFNSNKFTWNSGMFIFKTENIINELEIFSPDILNNCREALNKESKGSRFCKN